MKKLLGIGLMLALSICCFSDVTFAVKKGLTPKQKDEVFQTLRSDAAESRVTGLDGVTLGTTTLAQVSALYGEPKEVIDLVKMPPFEAQMCDFGTFRGLFVCDTLAVVERKMSEYTAEQLAFVSLRHALGTDLLVQDGVGPVACKSSEEESSYLVFLLGNKMVNRVMVTCNLERLFEDLSSRFDLPERARAIRSCPISEIIRTFSAISPI